MYPPKPCGIAFFIRENRDGNAKIVSPFYWSRWYHDGRGRISLKGKKGFLVYYKDPSQDPRISAGYPLQQRNRRRLTKAQFYRDKAAGKLVVKKEVGPFEGVPFFRTGTVGLSERVRPEIKKMLDAEVRKRLSRLKS